MMLRKRIKLSEVPRERGSQESKVTSTPRTISPVFTLSPSISSIENEEVPSEIDSEIESDEHRGSIPDSELPSLLGDLSLKRNRKRTRKPLTIKWEGCWSSLKPKNKDSLFYKIMAQPDEIESFTTDVLNIYSNDEKTGVITILQLFVDLCGFKKVSLSKIYNFETQNAKQVVDQMGNKLMEPELKKTGVFLFMKRSNFGSLIDNIIADFLNQFVRNSFETEVLFDDVLMGHLVEFINCMSFSSVRCIRVTGVFLVINFLTAFIDLYSQFLTAVQDENSNSTVENTDEKKGALETFIDFLYLICDKNCLIPDKKCYTIKIKFVQEMYSWIKLFPNIFILKRKCLGRLMKLILDQNENVRKAAILTCEKLIACEEAENEMKQRIDLCFKIISTRFLDANHTVAIKAITIFTEALDSYHENITRTHKLSIFHRMYEKNCLIAKTAGKFVAAYCQQRYKDDEQVLLYLVKIAFLRKEFAERLPFFVEACIDHIYQLKDWNLLVSTLLNEQIVFQTRKHLLQIFNEVARFTLTGNFSKTRRNFAGVRPNSQDHVEFAEVIIPNIRNIVIQFQKDKHSLKSSIELLMFIDYDADHSDDLRKHCLEILDLLKDLFATSIEKSLLEDITNVLSRFCANVWNIRADAEIDRIKTDYVKKLNDDLKQLTPTCDRNLLLNLRLTSMKLSILFAKFDLTDVLKWEDIYQVWDNNHLKVLKYLIVCCKWHLVWGLRQFIRASTDENGNNVNYSLLNNCRDFVHGCVDMLQHSNGNCESFLIFEALCDMYTSFETELKRKRQFSNFFIIVTELDRRQILLNFVVRHVIENTNLHLNQRQLLLNKLVNVIYLGAIPVDHFSTILRFYHSHYQEFGAIMNSILHQLNLSHPSLPLIILHTLADFYKQILERHRIINISSDESKQLKNLAKKFASVKEMKSPSGILKLVLMSIHFAFKEPQNYIFLYFARYFAKRLNESGKADAYYVFTRAVPEKDKDDEIILLFAGVLKSK